MYSILNLKIRDKKNMISSILSGSLVNYIKTSIRFKFLIKDIILWVFKFAIGWWIAIDAAAAYPANEQLLKASHTCGAIATVALIM